MNAVDAIRLAAILDRVTELSEVVGTQLECEVGPRFIRLVMTNYGSRSVHAFVDRANGDLIKAAGWKAPAKGVNGLAVRFNLLDDESFQACLKAAANGGHPGSTRYLYAH